MVECTLALNKTRLALEKVFVENEDGCLKGSLLWMYKS